MKTASVVVERTFEAPVSKVWSALTNINELKQWYFDLPDFQPVVGFKFDFLGGPEDGTQYLHLCEITSVVEGKKIAYSWRYDNYPRNSEVNWELLDRGEKTIVKLTHEGIHTLEEGGPDFDRANFTAGWNYFIHTSLKGFLEPVK